jgi:neuralized-like protein 4
MPGIYNENKYHVYPELITTTLSLQVGDRVGVVRHANGDLHFLVNGEDQGRAFTGVPDGVFGVVEIRYECAAVSIV